METKREKLKTIHNSLVNGQRKQMTELINEYGLYSFFEDYYNYLYEIYEDELSQYGHFADCVISFNHINNK